MLSLARLKVEEATRSDGGRWAGTIASTDMNHVSAVVVAAPGRVEVRRARGGSLLRRRPARGSYASPSQSNRRAWTRTNKALQSPPGRPCSDSRLAPNHPRPGVAVARPGRPCAGAAADPSASGVRLGSARSATVRRPNLANITSTIWSRRSKTVYKSQLASIASTWPAATPRGSDPAPPARHGGHSPDRLRDPKAAGGGVDASAGYRVAFFDLN